MTKLLKRLKAISEMVIKGESVADIGTDHALLAIYMLENELISNAVVTDINDGPFIRAKEAVERSGFKKKIEVRQGDGLNVIKSYEVSTVIIAGMGGDTIADIISSNWDKSESFKRFILQPMSRPHVIRTVLAERGWTLNEERVVFDNQKFFVILSYTPDNKPYRLTELEKDIGPLLLKNNYQYKLEYLHSFLSKYRQIVLSLQESNGSGERMLYANYLEKLHRLEEIVNGINQSEGHN